MKTLKLHRALGPQPLGLRIGLLLILALLLIAAGWPRGLQAADEGLYGAAAPPNSAFVRVFNASAQPLSAIRIGDQNIDEVAPRSASDFVFLPAGSQVLNSGSGNQNLSLQAGRYYTVVREDSGFTILDNPRMENRLKALVLFYNLTDGGTLGLKTADGRSAVVEGVKPDSFGSREVNAIKASLAVYDGATKVADARPQGLERGRAYSLFATGPASAPQLTWVVN